LNLKHNKIAFLINPEAGTVASRKQATELIHYLQKNNPKALYKTRSSEEVSEITADLAKHNFEAVFGCGGDGTLNLISKQLLGTDTALAMIPLGSGNGFARHHSIPLKWNKALEIIENPQISKRDTGTINGIHFLNIAGIGFAAKISHAFKGTKRRGLRGYTTTVVRNLRMEPFEAVVSNENSIWQGETWMVDFCNGSQWGNNFRVESGARDDDGTLNAVIFKKMSPVKIPSLGFRFASNTVSKSPDIYRISGASFVMEFEGRKPMHVDGEAIGFVSKLAEVHVIPKSLNIWTF